jgi:hypothetical protein
MRLQEGNLKSELRVVRRMSERGPESNDCSQGHVHVSMTTDAGTNKRSVESLSDQQHEVVARSLFSEFARRTFGRRDMKRPHPLCQSKRFRKIAV